MAQTGSSYISVTVIDRDSVPKLKLPVFQVFFDERSKKCLKPDIGPIAVVKMCQTRYTSLNVDAVTKNCATTKTFI
jgi:hypothetical protein